MFDLSQRLTNKLSKELSFNSNLLT